MHSTFNPNSFVNEEIASQLSEILKAREEILKNQIDNITSLTVQIQQENDTLIQQVKRLTIENEHLVLSLQEKDERIRQLQTIQESPSPVVEIKIEKKNESIDRWSLLVKMINDTVYWSRQKSINKCPRGILNMQAVLKKNPDDFNEIRKIGLKKYHAKNGCYLLFSYDNKNPMTELLYKIFTEVSSIEELNLVAKGSKSFNKLHNEWIAATQMKAQQKNKMESKAEPDRISR